MFMFICFVLFHLFWADPTEETTWSLIILMFLHIFAGKNPYHWFHIPCLFLQIMHGGGVESLQAVLAVQVVHKNALITAVNQANACQPSADTGMPTRYCPLLHIDSYRYLCFSE